MPVQNTPVTEFTRHVLDPLVQTRIQSIIKSFNLQNVINDNIHIKYGFSAGKSVRDKNKNITVRGNRLDVEVDTNLNPLNLKWDHMNFKMSSGYGYQKSQLTMDRAIFMDPEAGVHLHLHETPCNVTINLNITVTSRTVAYTVLSQYYNLYHGEDNTYMYTDFMYDLPVNISILRLLHDIYNMRDFDTSKISFPGYVYAGSACAISELVNRNQTRKEIVLRRHRTKLIQEVTMTADKPQENNDNQGTFSYTIPISITTQFSRPDFYTMFYPITVSNKMIPVRHIVPSYTQNETMNNVNYLQEQVERYTYEHWENEYKHFVTPFVSPYYDDWVPRYGTEERNYTQRPFWILAVTLDENEDGSIKDLTDVVLFDDIIDGYRLHPIVEEIIGIQGCESYEPDCLFNISVYKNDVQYVRDELSWNIDSRAVSIPKDNKMYRYHIVISEMLDLNFLNPKWEFLVDRYDDFFKNKKNQNNNNNGADNGSYISKRVFYGDIIPLKQLVY